MRIPAVLVAIFTICAICAEPASADLFTPEPANSTPGSTASWSQQQSYCNATCSTLVNGSGQVLGLNGSVGWTVADDLWCANHGSQTDPLVGPSPEPNLPAPPVGSCPVTLLPGDTNCNQTVSMLAHCSWHNGQLEQECEAYEAASGSNTGEKAVLALDIAATGTCGAACATTVANPTLVSACRIAGTTASVTELMETLMQTSSAMSKAISAATASMGLAMNLRDAVNLEDLTAKGANTTQGLGNGLDNYYVKGQSTSPKRDKSSCMAALMYGAMAGMRYGNIHSAQSTQQNACTEVEQLASAAATIGNGAIPIPTNLASGGSTGVTSGGGTGATDTADSSLNCVGSGGSVSSCTGQSTTSPDVAALTSSGLAQQLAPAAAQIANSPAMSSGGAGNAAGAAASGAGAPTDIAGAVSTVAAAAQDQSHELFEKGGAMAGGGGGGGGSDSSDAPPNPMAMLAAMLGQGKNSSTPQGGVTAYRGPAQSADIYHANSPDNLFQIISGRIQKDSARIQ